MKEQSKTERLLAAAAEQEIILIAVAEESRYATDADGDYRRLHAEMRSLLTGTGVGCFCPWSSVHQWYGLARSLGDPGWREHLTQLVAPFQAYLSAPLPEAPKYRLRRYVRTPGDVPFATWQVGLDEAKQVLLDRSLIGELAHQGPAVCSDYRKGKPIKRSGKKVFEYKIQANATTVGYPKEAISLRVFFCMGADGAVVLLHGYDKGASPSDKRQKIEIDEAFRRLDHYRAQEDAFAASQVDRH